MTTSLKMDCIPETELTERKKFIDDLEEFITQTQTLISTVLQTLSWTPEHFLKVSSSWKANHPYPHTREI